MAGDRRTTRVHVNDGYVPLPSKLTQVERGYVPTSPKPQGGHVPTTGEGGPSGPPPSAPSVVQPPPKK